MNYLYTGLLSVVALALAACMNSKPKETREKKYDYETVVTSADGYECLISWADCHLGTYSMPFLAEGSWGGGRPIMHTNLDVKRLPDSIQVVCFSLTEDCFYKLHAPLDKERVRTLLKAQYKTKDRDEYDYYSWYTIGIAPGGSVNLWLSGSESNLCLNSYQAEKVEYSFKRAFPDCEWTREKMVREYSKQLYPFIKKEMKEGRISGEYWTSLNTAYPWALTFKDKEFSLFGYGIYFINQERRCSLTDPSWLVEAGDKFIPAELTLYLKHNTNSEKYKITIKLRDPYIVYSHTVEKGVSVNNYMNKSRALLRFFDSFYKKAQGKDVELYVDTSGEKLTPKLKAGDLEEEFPDYEVEVSNFIKYDYRQ